jgi:hypothetical protein
MYSGEKWSGCPVFALPEHKQEKMTKRIPKKKKSTESHKKKK